MARRRDRERGGGAGGGGGGEAPIFLIHGARQSRQPGGADRTPLLAQAQQLRDSRRERGTAERTAVGRTEGQTGAAADGGVEWSGAGAVNETEVNRTDGGKCEFFAVLHSTLRSVIDAGDFSSG